MARYIFNLLIFSTILFCFVTWFNWNSSKNSFTPVNTKIHESEGSAGLEDFNFQFISRIDANLEQVSYSLNEEPLSFRLNYQTIQQVPTFITPLVGDIDNDGNVELVTMGMRNFFSQGSSTQPERSGNILIFNGKTGDLIREFFTPMMAFQGLTPIVIGDVNQDGYAEIIISTLDRTNNPIQDRGILICFDHLGNELWRTQ